MAPIIRLALVFFLACLLVFTALPEQTSAFPYKLQGYLKDDNGVPIPLANISISGEKYDMATQDMVETTYYRLTDEYGYYIIYFGADEPGGFYMDSVITVSYVSEDDVTTTTMRIEGLSGWANLTYHETPGLADYIVSPTGVAVIIISASAVIVSVYLFRRGKSPDAREEPSQTPPKTRRRRK